MPRKAKGKPEEHGIYCRGEVYWLRYNWGGKQVFVNLRVRTKAEAIEEAKNHRGQPPVVDTVEGWESEIARYVREKQSPVSPPGFTGKRWVSMNAKTAKKTISVLRVFARWSDTHTPREVSLETLKAYLKLRIEGGATPYVTRKGAKLKGNRAGARSTLSAICAFLRHVRCMPPGKLDLPSRGKLERRQLVFSRDEISRWIANADDDNAKLALVLGFRCGLRENEIMHARSDWLIPKRGVLKVPHEDRSFTSKDLSYREVPPFSEDLPFLRKMAKERTDGYLLRKTNRMGRPAKIGVYHFEKPLRNYLKTQGVETFTLHSMRHSFATNLFSAGVALEVIAQWMGDEPETVRRSYIHGTASAGEADDAHRGETMQAKLTAQLVSQGEQLATLMASMAQITALLGAGKIDEARKIAARLDELPGPDSVREYEDPDSPYFIDEMGRMPNLP
jgi:integrase